MGFSVISGDQFGIVVRANNASFDGTKRGGVMSTDGQLWIGSSITPRVKVGTITSPLGTVSIGYSSPNITIDIAGGGAAISQVTVDAAQVITPSGSPANITITGNTVANGTNSKPVFVIKNSSSSALIDVQVSTALAAADITKTGLANFDSASFGVAATGFVTLSGTGVGKTITGNSGGALSPTAGNWNILGASTAAGTSPVTTSGSVSTLTVNVQKSQAIASTDATKIGLAAFDSAKFTVDANGFVSTTGIASNAFNQVKNQVFTSTGTYTPTTGMKYCQIICIGGGGAGGGAPTTTASNTSCGSGGGAGEYAVGIFAAATIGVSQAVTIGAGGTGVSGANGNNGGTTSVGSLITANGGTGGLASTSASLLVTAVGQAGGTGGTGGDYRCDGANGTFGVSAFGVTGSTIQGHGGDGGNSYLGAGGRGALSAGNGGGGHLYGSGGGGSLTFASAATTGGTGDPGIVIVTEYISV